MLFRSELSSFNACLNLDNTIRLTGARSGQKVINIPSSAKYVSNDVEIEAPITVIASEFLNNDSYAISVYIPSDIPTIEEGAFANCESLVIYCESQNKEAGWSDNWTDGTIPVYWNVTSSSHQAMINSIIYTIVDGKAVISGHDENIKSAVVPTSVEIDGNNYPVESIGARAFANASSMASIYIPSSIKSVSDSSFEGCNSLTVYFEGSATPGFNDYYSRPVYENVNFDDIIQVNYIEYLVNRNNGEATATSYVFGLANAAIPDVITDSKGTEYKVAAIGNGAFQGCSDINRVSFGANVKSIGDRAFQECKGLTNYVVIPESVEYLGDWAFALTSKHLVIYVEAAQIPSTWALEWDAYNYDSENDDESIVQINTYIGLDIAWEYRDNVPTIIVVDNEA